MKLSKTSILGIVLSSCAGVGLISSLTIVLNTKKTGIELPKDFEHHLYPTVSGKVTLNFEIKGISSPETTTITIPEFDQLIKISNDVFNKPYTYTISKTGHVELIIDTSKFFFSEKKDINFSIVCKNSLRKFNKVIDKMTISIPKSSYQVTALDNPHVQWLSLPPTMTYNESYVAGYQILEGHNVISRDLYVGGYSIKDKPGVVFTENRIEIPSSLAISNLYILIETENKQYTITKNSEHCDIVSYSNIDYGEDLNGYYSIEKGYEIDTYDILCGDKSLKNYSDVIFSNGQIFVPAKYINNNLTINITTKQINYKFSEQHGDGFTFTSEVPSTFIYGEEINLKYSCTSSILNPYIFTKIDNEFYSLLDYPDVKFADGEISIPGRFVQGDIFIYAATNNLHPIFTSADNITFNNIPSYIDDETNIDATYKLDTNYRITNKQIYISNTCIYNNGIIAGYENVNWDDGKIFIPKEYIKSLNGMIIITCQTSNCYDVTVSGEHICYKYSKQAIVGQNYDATYTVDPSCEFQQSSTKIICNGVDITSKQGNYFANGSIHIDKQYITGNITISASIANLYSFTTYGENITYTSPSLVSGKIKQGTTIDIKATVKAGYALTGQYIYIGSKLVYENGKATSGYENITWDDGKIYIPGSYVTNHISIGATTTLDKFNVTCSGKHIDVVSIPYVKLKQTFTQTFSIHDGYWLEDYDVIINGQSYKNTSYVTVGQNSIRVSGSIVTGDVFINLKTNNECPVETEGLHINYEYAEHNYYKQDFHASYKIIKGSTLNNWDITVNGVSIKNKPDVKFADGEIFIPGNLVLGKIKITTDISTSYTCVYSKTLSNVKIYNPQPTYGWTADLQYSFDGENWTQLGAKSGQKNNIDVPTNSCLYLKGTNSSGWTRNLTYATSIRITGNAHVSGQINALIGSSASKEKAYNFAYLFSGSTGLTSIDENFLPATTLVANCYSHMFNGCTNLLNTPNLPATKMTSSCYSNMFSGCSKITSAPLLDSTELAEHCYEYMFNGCTNLLNTPNLPATTLQKYCYQYMFQGCKSILSSPELFCTSLTTNNNLCYSNMFSGCTNLQYIKVHFTSWSNLSHTNSWLKDVSSSGVFCCPESLKETRGASSIPNGWSIERF